MAIKKSKLAPEVNAENRPSSENRDIYQLKITLLGTNPPIWRRILVPADLNLAQMHKVLQTAMGWYDMHMHEFRLAQRRFGQPEPADPFTKTPPVEDDRRVRLSAVLQRTRAKMVYIYDFGDYWEHEILLEQQLPAEPNATYPACVDGQLACPPEDCGGIPGYYDLLDVLQKPPHRRHKEIREWVGGDFDSETFSVEEANRRLAPRSRRKCTSVQ